MLHAVLWAEIPVTDFERSKKFYSSIYDYEMPEMMMGKNRMGFLLYDRQNKGVGAAIVQGEGYIPTDKGPRIYLNGGDDLDIILNRIPEAGGTIILKKTFISPSDGYFAIFKDPEGNIISLHSSN